MNKVLCIDDSKLIRKIVSQAAEMLGFEVVEACNGEEGISHISRDLGEIVLITLDWHMPKMNGYEFLETIKQREETKDIPVLMLTSESGKTNIVKAIKAGVNNYLLKPFSQEDLLVKMQECLGKAAIREEIEKQYESSI